MQFMSTEPRALAACPSRDGIRRILLFWLWGTFGTLTLEAGSGFLQQEGSKIYYEVAGSGPDMVFLHDGHMHGSSWDAQWEFFSRSNRVIRYDRRGYGKSEPAREQYSNVEDLRVLLVHLRATNVVLVGCSAGGRLALDFALEHPAFVRRLMLAGPVVDGLDFSEHFDQRIRERFRPLRERNDVGATITNWMNDSWLIAATNFAARERFRRIMSANPQNLARTSQPSRSPSRPAISRLSEVRAPTLIVVGESDMPDVHAHSGALQAGIGRAQRVVISGAGHFVHLERPEEFNRLVASFLAGSGRPKDLVYYVPAMDGALVRSNLVFKTAGELRLEADLYLPSTTASEARLPAIIFVLGDAEPDKLRHAKDWAFMQSYGRLAAASGFAGITFNHRSSENSTKLRDVRSDVEDVIHYVRTNAATLNVNADKLCLWFFSGSGVHLETGMGTNVSFVRCMVGFYPVLVPSRRASMSEDVRRKFSAIEQLKRHSGRIPPLLLAKAGQDSVSLNQTLDQYRKAASQAGVLLEFLEHPSGEHAFDIRNDDETSREIVQRTLRFIERHLR